ncbi:hypothetical protein PR202_gb14694 [Eleusine coracana subsp. coracana]|uniref:F-box domain-containing protein n=1 Tax=Eleusine coracana subsp. coracana TaxID=191504 RepID=A0AAV5EVZ1_ELECO|nr:hypothetical protein PR202_gb14694 [Eleusine coracana subsp. coracana]
MGPCTSGSWSDLPIDILLIILRRLELPQTLVFASVCKTWRSAVNAAGLPRSCTPWILSWANHLEKKKKNKAQGKCNTAVTCNSYHLDVEDSYDISFPRDCFVTCCGASHGWLVLVNELSNLVLYNPFTTAMIPLPPTTDFACVEGVYGTHGNLEHYRYRSPGELYAADCFGIPLYAKAVLSCSPSKRNDYVVMVIHHDGTWLSFVKAGQSKWQVASTSAGRMGGDRYLDCAYHDGSFYTVTFYGLVEKWDLDDLSGPTREEMVVAIPAIPAAPTVLTRNMVSTPWGDLLQVIGFRALEYPYATRFQVCKVDQGGCKKSPSFSFKICLMKF